MTTVNMHEAKSNLSKLVEAVETGETEEVIIARNGKPVARIVRFDALRDALPQGTPRVSAEARRQAIAARQAHVAWRERP